MVYHNKYSYHEKIRRTVLSTNNKCKAVRKRRKGRFVEYLIVAQEGGQTPRGGTWKRNKDMTQDEKDACRNLRDAEQQQVDSVKAAARRYVEAAMRGDESAMARQLRVGYDHNQRYSLEELEPHLAVFLNQANIREDQDIGDWGNVKRSIHVYEDTPLIHAIRNDNMRVVLTLLRTGLCDPTLESCPHEYIDERYTPRESDIRTALKCATGTRMEGPVEMALTMWPTARYASHEVGRDRRGMANYNNRMHGVDGASTQSELRELLMQRLASLSS